jgi:hypothetical protein
LVPAEETFGTPAERQLGLSVITGSAPEAAGKLARLVDAVGNEQRQAVGPDDLFRFDNLPPGVYSLHVEGGYTQPNLSVDGSNGVMVTFQPLNATWEAKVSPAGSMPGYSVVRVEVEGMRNLPVYIWKEDWEGMMRRTGTKPEYGDCAAEFAPLGPGHYMVEPEGLGLWADVELTGLEVVWVDFRRKVVPSEPNHVALLDQDTIAALPPRSVPTAATGWERDDFGGFEAEEYELAQHDDLDGSPAYAAWRTEDAGVDPVSDEDVTSAFDPEHGDDPAAQEEDDEDLGWLRSQTAADDYAFSFPSFTRDARTHDVDDGTNEGADDGADDDDLGRDDSDARWQDDDLSAYAAAVPPAAPPDAPEAAGAPPPSFSTDRPLCLLIPQPVSDLDELAALLRFVAKAAPVMARRVEEVPAGAHVLLIGAGEEWQEIEVTLTARGITSQRVTRSLVELFGDPGDSDLY